MLTFEYICVIIILQKGMAIHITDFKKEMCFMEEQKKYTLKPQEIIIIVVCTIFFTAYMFGIGAAFGGHSRSLSKSSKDDFIDRVYSSYSQNSAVCLEKYDGKKVSFECKVASVEASLDSIYICSTNDDDYSFRMICCTLNSEKLQNKAKKLKKGDKIKIKGTMHFTNEMVSLFIIDTESIS